MIQLQRILLPTDFSELSAAATKYACELAKKFDAELHLLNVLESPNVPDLALEMLPPAPVREERTSAAESMLADLVDPEMAAGRTIINAVTEGVPFVEIVRYAKAHDIDLIIIGTHGRSGLAHLLLGSVAENVVRKAPCPVLTVRPEGHQFVMPWSSKPQPAK